MATIHSDGSAYGTLRWREAEGGRGRGCGYGSAAADLFNSGALDRIRHRCMLRLHQVLPRRALLAAEQRKILRLGVLDERDREGARPVALTDIGAEELILFEHRPNVALVGLNSLHGVNEFEHSIDACMANNCRRARRSLRGGARGKRQWGSTAQPLRCAIIIASAAGG